MFSFDLFKYILAKEHLECRVGVAGTMADECITPYSKICSLDSNLISGDV